MSHKRLAAGTSTAPAQHLPSSFLLIPFCSRRSSWTLCPRAPVALCLVRYTSMLRFLPRLHPSPSFHTLVCLDVTRSRDTAFLSRLVQDTSTVGAPTTCSAPSPDPHTSSLTPPTLPHIHRYSRYLDCGRLRHPVQRLDDPLAHSTFSESTSRYIHRNQLKHTPRR